MTSGIELSRLSFSDPAVQMNYQILQQEMRLGFWLEEERWMALYINESNLWVEESQLSEEEHDVLVLEVVCRQSFVEP